MIMLRTILKGICLLLLLVSMNGCLIGWYDDGRDRRGDGRGGGHRGSGGHDDGGGHGGGHDERR